MDRIIKFAACLAKLIMIRDGILFATFVSIAQQISYPLASELGAEGS